MHKFNPMQKVLNIYKPIGLTPLQLIQKVREYYPELNNEKISYAGRLDPMAHGVMLLLIGEENKNRNEYLGLPKTYQFQVIFGVETDSYDILGLIKSTVSKNLPVNLEEEIKNFIKLNKGKQIQKYPPYSSKTVHGKPLFKWAREGKLSEISFPKKEIQIYKFKLLNLKQIDNNLLKLEILKKLAILKGDFRQEEVKRNWLAVFKKTSKINLVVAKLEVTCSSGTYMRSLAQELGVKIGCGAIAYDILRTQVGKWNLKNSHYFQLPTSEVGS